MMSLLFGCLVNLLDDECWLVNLLGDESVGWGICWMMSLLVGQFVE